MDTVDDTRTRRRPTAGTAVAAVVALVLLALPTLLGSARGQDVLADLSLRHTEAAFTELAFPNPAAIPGFVAQDGDTKFSFTLTNRGEETERIRWRVAERADVTDATTSRRLTSGVLEVAPGQTVTRDVATVVRCRERSRVVVETTAPGERTQSVSFIVQGLRSSSGFSCYAGARR